ncbi:uncharacterized protein LOC128822300 [Vidua macroura]|uniref:uncharacterized protein LOC128822300 n=1 Tax=Vidua macroura TaxID=187451 RepID=UPI0023A8FCBB|nr:uncharacterized protein LOC128822300 [Vidua macroura]
MGLMAGRMLLFRTWLSGLSHPLPKATAEHFLVSKKTQQPHLPLQFGLLPARWPKRCQDIFLAPNVGQEALYIFPNVGNYLAVVMLMCKPGYGMRIALLIYYVYCIITSEAMNMIWNMYSILFACPNLGCYVWGLSNHTQPLGGGVKIDFFHPFRLDTAVFENVKFPLDAKDSIMLLLVLLSLLCTVCNMLRNKTLHSVMQQNIHSVMQCLLEEEETRSKAAVSVSIQNATTASMLTQTVTEEEGSKSKTTVSVSMQTAMEEETKSEARVSMSTQTDTEEEGTESAISISTQTITKPEQPEPIVVAPVQKKKSRSKSVRIVTDEDAAGPSHPAEETEPEIITRSIPGLAEQVRDLIEESHQKLKKELKEEVYHISPEPTRVSAIRSRRSQAKEKGYTPRGNLCFFLQEHGEDMKKWDGKPTSSLAARVRELKRTPNTKSSSSVNAAPVSHTQNSRQYRNDDITDPLEGTSRTYLQEESNVYHDQE